MDNRLLIQFLQNSGRVTLTSAQNIAAVFSYKEIPKGNFFLKQSVISNEYFFLEKGFMRSFAFDTDDNDVTTNFYADNQMVFEVSSFFKRTASRENIQAIRDCYGWAITYQQLNDLFHAMPEFREFGRAVLVKGFSSLKTRMLSLITETAEQRYAALLKNNPEIFKEAALKHIASYLGITDTSLSRIRKEFSKK